MNIKNNKILPSLNKYKIKNKAVEIGVGIFRYVFLISVSYVILYPLFAMIAYSILSKSDIADSSVIWIAKNPTFDNFVISYKALDYFKSLLNTILVGGVSAFLEIFSCALVAYGLARFKFKENKLLFSLVLLTAIVPVQIMVIPLFINYKYFDFAGILTLVSKIIGSEEAITLDLIDTPFTFWLPSLLGVGFRSGICIFIYRQFFMGLPKELEEASWIDGASPLKTFLKVVIPSSGVVFLTVTIFAVIWHWNEYYQSVIFFTSNFPLAVRLSDIVSLVEQYGVNKAYAASYVCAACLMFITPVLIMFLFLQKKFIQSIDKVGIVG